MLTLKNWAQLGMDVRADWKLPCTISSAWQLLGTVDYWSVAVSVEVPTGSTGSKTKSVCVYICVCVSSSRLQRSYWSPWIWRRAATTWAWAGWVMPQTFQRNKLLQNEWIKLCCLSLHPLKDIRAELQNTSFLSFWDTRCLGKYFFHYTCPYLRFVSQPFVESRLPLRSLS